MSEFMGYHNIWWVQPCLLGTYNANQGIVQFLSRFSTGTNFPLIWHWPIGYHSDHEDNHRWIEIMLVRRWYHVWYPIQNITLDPTAKTFTIWAIIRPNCNDVPWQEVNYMVQSCKYAHLAPASRCTLTRSEPHGPAMQVCTSGTCFSSRYATDWTHTNCHIHHWTKVTFVIWYNQRVKVLIQKWILMRKQGCMLCSCIIQIKPCFSIKY